MVGRIYVRERMQALRSVLQNAVLLAGRAVVLSSNSHCMLFMPLRSAAFAQVLLRKTGCFATPRLAGKTTHADANHCCDRTAAFFTQ